jgi:hypothetical protein
MSQRMNAAAPLAEELTHVSAEIARLERRIADGEGGIADHILLQAILRTRTGMRAAVAAKGVGWPLPPSASTITTTPSREAGRPLNVVQLFLTSTHRVAPPSNAAGNAVLGVF